MLSPTAFMIARLGSMATPSPKFMDGRPQSSETSAGLLLATNTDGSPALNSSSQTSLTIPVKSLTNRFARNNPSSRVTAGPSSNRSKREGFSFKFAPWKKGLCCSRDPAGGSWDRKRGIWARGGLRVQPQTGPFLEFCKSAQSLRAGQILKQFLLLRSTHNFQATTLKGEKIHYQWNRESD